MYKWLIKISICLGIGTALFWFAYHEFSKPLTDDWKQVEKPVKIINGTLYKEVKNGK